ncbi:MAG: ribonuclease H-like domain-containing protein [Nitrosopumilaceae archaeon]
MPNFYLDIETTGLNPQDSKIISIQFAQLHDGTSEQIGELRILKEWESSEKEILKQFIVQSEITGSYPFSFISVGFNLQFEHNFFIQRCKANGLEPIDIFNKPHIDIKPFAVIMNNGQFKGSGLDKITGKPHGGGIVPQWYNEKKYNEIENYIKKEATEFINLCVWLYKELPLLLGRFKMENGII